MPPPAGTAAFFFSLISVIAQSVVSSNPAIDETFAQWRTDPIEAQRAAVAEPAEV